MVRKFLALMLLLMAQPLFAQIAPQPSETKPPDVPSFSFVSPLWKTDGTQNTPVDATVTPPSELQGLTEVNPMTDPTYRVSTNSHGGATFQGYISGTTLTVTSTPVGTITPGDAIYIQSSSSGAGTISGGESAVINAYGSGGTTGTGSNVGTYQIAVTQANIGDTTSPVNLGTTATVFCLTTVSNGPCQQAKFRTQADITTILFDDPERNYGQPGTSHLHQFFGNRSCNAYSTYSSVRTRNKTAAAGSDANATCYWYPAFVKKAADTGFGDGIDYAVQSTLVIIYYQEDNPANGPLDTRIPRGLRYVFGTNMDDPDNSMLQRKIYLLNQTIGTNRYKLIGSTGKYDTQGSYNCQGATPAASFVLTNADGTDPFNGTCASGANFWIGISGAACWDGTNLWSPGGYNHVIKQIYNGQFGEFECPYNYYRIPFLHQEIHFAQSGASDFTKWRLSSDDNAQAKLDGFSICAADYSNAPCANGATFTGYISGTTLTVTGVSAGAMCLTTANGTPGELGHNGYQLEGTGITGHPIIESQSGTVTCGTGTYTLSVNEGTVGSAGAPVTLRASEYVANGQSIHEDWLFGWDNATIESWEFNCIGVEHHTPHECDSSQIDATHHLLGGNTNERGVDRNPQVLTDESRFPTTSPVNMFAIPTTSHGPMTMHTNTH